MIKLIAFALIYINMLSFYELYHLIQEGYKGKKEQFVKELNQPRAKEIVEDYINRFKIIAQNPNKTLLNHNIPNLTISVNDRLNIDKYPNFKQLEIFVDYYEGQLNKSKIDFDDVKFSGEPLTEKNGLVIYYADTPKACVEIKGDADHSWCIARPDAGNMFYILRFGYHQPAFYFIKNQNRKDKYYFFVLQVLKGAELGNVTNKQYIVTSSENDGDLEMSWSQIVSIEPRLDGLQEIFVHKPLSPKQQELYNRFKDGLTDEEFAALLTDKERSFYIDVVRKLTGEQFRECSNELKNKYIGLNVGLSNIQYEMIKNKPGLMKRYVYMVLRKLENVIKNNNNWNFTNSEKEVIKNNMNDELLNKIISKPEYAFKYAKYVLNGENVPPEVINGLSQEPENAYYYARDVLNWKNVPPEVVNGLIKNPFYALSYARDVLKGKNVPPEVVNSLIQDPENAYYYARDVLNWKNVPPEVVNSFSKLPYYAFDYARDVLKWKNVPPEVVNGLIQEPFYALSYARSILKGKDVPPEVVNSIIKEPRYAFEYANDVLKGKNVPELVINSLIKKPNYAFLYATQGLKGKDVPEEVLDSIHSDPKYAREYKNFLDKK